MNRTINFYVKTALGAVIAGALVRIFTTAGVFVTEGTTDGSGKAGPFLLPDGDYEVAAFYQGAVFPLPFAVTVSQDQDYDLEGTLPTAPTATDALRCRIYGVLRAPSGIPISNAVVIFTPQEDAVLMGGDPIYGDVRRKTDKNGVLDVELYRDLKYHVRIPWIRAHYLWAGFTAGELEKEGFMSKVLCVPNQSSLNFGDFLMPRPARIQFSTPAVSLAVGASNYDESVSVLLTNGVTSETAELDYLEYKSSDENVATVAVSSDGSMQICGEGAGTATVEVVRKDTSPTVNPDTALVVDSFTITVT